MIPIDVFEKQADKFGRYVRSFDKNNSALSFAGKDGVLAKEEGYKSLIPSKARSILRIEEWDESWIGSGKIKERIAKAVEIADNLINYNSKIDFCNHFESDKATYNPESERVIYEIYKGNDDKAAFEHAMKVFGAKYPVLSYLYFIKDETRYLPISPNNFDRSLSELGIDFVTSYRCSWENYCRFVEIVNEVKSLLPKYLDFSHEIGLLDAHSFLWLVGEKKYMDWEGESADINTPLSPKNVFHDEENILRYQCPRCDYLFKANGRCPECGQSIK